VAITRQTFDATIYAVGTQEKVSSSTFGGGSFNSTDLLAGDVLVMAVATDNLSATTPTFTVDSNPTECGGWTQITQLARNASAAAGLAVTVFTTTLVSGGVSLMNTPTVTLSGAVVAKVMRIIALRGCSETQRGTVQTANGSSTSPSVVSPSATSGDVVIGVSAAEQNTEITGDSDTTNGSWSSNNETGWTTGGGSAANMSLKMQTKIVSAGGTQTYDTTSANTDWIQVAFVLQPAAVSAFAPPFRNKTRRYYHLLGR
jgi:hypothetical protein